MWATVGLGTKGHPPTLLYPIPFVMLEDGLQRRMSSAETAGWLQKLTDSEIIEFITNHSSNKK
jgi:hypothetical protein